MISPFLIGQWGEHRQSSRPDPTAGPASPDYRPDIDGLRAIAVVAVFAYHLLPWRFPAGGIGVDVFFVISGYLIGGILLREAQAGSLTLRSFYERRLRRIAPAFIVMIALTSLLACKFLLPRDLIAESRSALAALFSVSNFYFWQNSGYFDQQSSELPLLHTWSLGEEQFYLTAPLLILLLSARAPRLLVPTLLVVTVASLAWSEFLVRTGPQGAFYLPHSRAWELLVGVNLNVIPIAPLRSRLIREIIAAAGAAGLFVSLLVIQPANGFPGLTAVAPCLATACLIAAGEQGPTVVGTLLSLSALRFVGLISYSLYLWHWPVILFTREYLGVSNSTHGVIPISVALAFSLAILSWRFVEQPFRSRRGFSEIALATAFAASTMAGLQILVLTFDGLPMRMPTTALRLAQFSGEYDRDGSSCLYRGKGRQPVYNPADCLHADSGKKNVLLIGDSHAAMFRTALGEALDANVLEIAAAACDIAELGHLDIQSDCASFIRKMLTTNVPWPEVRYVFISSRWATNDLSALTALVEELRRRAPVVLIGPVPEYETGVPKLLAASIIKDRPSLVHEMLHPGLGELDQRLSSLATQLDVQYASPMQHLCSSEGCQVTLDGEPIYLDRDHLTMVGARYVLNGIAKELKIRGGHKL